MTRIFIADPQSKVRFALKVVLESQYKIQVVGTAATSQDLLIILKHTQVDLLLLDSNLPDMPLKDLVGVIRQKFPQIRILVMGTDLRAKKTPILGVEDYINKGEAASHLFDILNRCAVPALAH